MSPVDFMKGPCCRVEFRGQGPYELLGGGEGYKKGRAGHVKFYPYEKGGPKSFSHAEEGAQQILGSFYTEA